MRECHILFWGCGLNLFVLQVYLCLFVLSGFQTVVVSLQNIQTVTSFGLQPTFEQKLTEKVVKAHKYVLFVSAFVVALSLLWSLFCHFYCTWSLFVSVFCYCRLGLFLSFILGITYAYSQSITLFAYIIAFRFGAFQVTLDPSNVVYVEFFDVYRVFAALVFGSLAVGAVGTFAPDFDKAKVAAGHAFQIIDREPFIDAYSEDGYTPVSLRGFNLIALYTLHTETAVYVHVCTCIMPCAKELCLSFHFAGQFCW